MNATEKYMRRADMATSLLCIGLDSGLDRIPQRFQHEQHPQFAFNRYIIDQTHPYTAAYKPNMAFYETRGAAGLHELQMTMDYLRSSYPDIFTICDAKRGDIGSTSAAYATAVFDTLAFDAITLHPYTGRDGLAPFLERADKACIVLCRTSNPGAGELQDLPVDGRTLWETIAIRVSREWNNNGNCMLVVGATYPEELRRVRGLVGDMTLLVPGVGAQGGDLQAAVEAGLNSAGQGLIINASRGVILADEPAAAARALRDDINRWR